MLNKSSRLACACGVKFETERSMRYHARDCPSMSCCGRYNSNLSKLREHIDTAHNNQIPVDVRIQKPRCQFCGKNDFKTTTGRDSHTNYYCPKNLHLFQSDPALYKGSSAPPPNLKGNQRKNHSVSLTSDFKDLNNTPPKLTALSKPPYLKITVCVRQSEMALDQQENGNFIKR